MKTPNEKKILFSGRSNNDTIDLSDSAENYEYVEIVYDTIPATNLKITNRIKMKNGEISTIPYMTIAHSSSNNTDFNQIGYVNIKLLNNQIIKINGAYLNVAGNASIAGGNFINTGIHIVEVVGHNRN